MGQRKALNCSGETANWNCSTRFQSGLFQNQTLVLRLWYQALSCFYSYDQYVLQTRDVFLGDSFLS